MPKILAEAHFQFEANVVMAGHRAIEKVVVHDRVPVEIEQVNTPLDRVQVITPDHPQAPPTEYVGYDGKLYKVPPHPEQGMPGALTGTQLLYGRDKLRVSFNLPPLVIRNGSRSVSVDELKAGKIRQWVSDDREARLASLRRFCGTVLVNGSGARQSVLAQYAPPRWSVNRSRTAGTSGRITIFQSEREAVFADNPACGTPNGIMFPFTAFQQAQAWLEELVRETRSRGQIAPPERVVVTGATELLSHDSMDQCAPASAIGMTHYVMRQKSVMDFPDLTREVLAAWCDMRDARDAIRDGKPALSEFMRALEVFLTGAKDMNTTTHMRVPASVLLKAVKDGYLDTVLAPTITPPDEDLESLASLSPC